MAPKGPTKKGALRTDTASSQHPAIPRVHLAGKSLRLCVTESLPPLRCWFTWSPSVTPAVCAAHCVGRLAEHVAPRKLEHVARDLAHGWHLAIEQVGR